MNLPITLKLCMIVRNAESCIAATLFSYKPFISSWCILDTGSTDRTPEIIRETMEGVPGALHIRTFQKREFNKMRNAAFELAENDGIPAEFLIMPDDSYILNGGHKLLQSLTNAIKVNPHVVIIITFIKDVQQTYPGSRIVRMSAKLRWKLRVHEKLDLAPDTPAFTLADPEIYMYDNINKLLLVRSETRRKSDLEMLLEDHADYPEDTRIWFYIGLTNHILAGENPQYMADAIKWFKKRLAAVTQTPDEEAFECARYLININDNMQSDEKISKYMIPGIHACTARAPEILCAMAEKYIKPCIPKAENNFAKAHTPTFTDYFMARMLLEYSAMLPKPTNTEMFFNPEIYSKFIPLYLKRVRDVFAPPENTQMTAMLDKSFINLALDPAKKVCAFVTGDYYNPWNGATRPLGGSEIMLVKMAEYCAAQGMHTFVFIGPAVAPYPDVGDQPTTADPHDTRAVVNGVTYLCNTKFQSFTTFVTIDYCIVSRVSGYLRFTFTPRVKNVVMWLHDCVPVGDPHCSQTNFRKFITLTTPHRELLCKELSIPKEMTAVCGNTVDLSAIRKGVKVPNSIIYSSAANRGLSVLLACWPKIIAALPDATLELFVDLPSKLLTADENMLCINTISKWPNAIAHHGFSNQAKLYPAFGRAQFWVYPDFTFFETFCITAIEAQAAGCLCITSRLGALSETVNKGVTLRADTATLSDPQFVNIHSIADQIVAGITLLHKNPQIANEWISENLKFVQQFTMDRIGPKFMALCGAT